MNGFNYNDIFQTKGIEYLVIIAFLLSLILFWRIINRKVPVMKQVQKVLETLTIEILKIPRGVFYGRAHTWTHLEKSGIAQVGLDDFLLHLTGEVKLSRFKNDGDFIRKGEIMTELNRNGKVLRVFSPISGMIVGINPLLEADPSKIIKDPYEQGWIYRIEPSDWMMETGSYRYGDDAVGWFRNELDHFKDFVSTVVAKNSPETSGMVMQSGGELLDHPLAELPGEIWQDFQDEFLRT